ncbi:MAG: hypothetical protein WBE37_14700 [Bryobacteraceae bacterium]
MSVLQNLPEVVVAIGGLGTAASGLVDATKVFGGGVNHIGFQGIRAAVQELTDAAETVNALSQKKIIATLEANWMNGTDLASQKDIAKSLIKLNLHPRNARALADATGVDADILTSVAASIAAGNPLSAAGSEVFARFDLIVTAVLDEAYQRSNQVYRNWTRALAALVAIGLAMAGGRELGMAPALSLLAGLLATPFAPIAKDLSSALTTSVNAMHLAKR